MKTLKYNTIEVMKNNLQEYIDRDEVYTNYKKGYITDSDVSDFDMFCIDHCSDIENILNYLYVKEQEVEKLRVGNSALMEALVQAKTKHNQDKARYRRKAKRYRAERNHYKNILTELEKSIDLYLEVYDNIDVQSLNLIKDKIKELKEME